MINYYKSPAIPVCGSAWHVDEYFFINTINYYKSPALPVSWSAWLVDEYFLLILLIIINLPHYLYVEVLDSSMSIVY